MSKVSEIICLLRKHWTRPREATHRGERCPFLLACRFAAEPADAVDLFHLSIPEDVREFWLATRTATLFKDEQYGQWGLEVLEPARALAETSRQARARPRDFMSSDLVLARFLGDSDLVVLACDPSRPDFGLVKIALPVDKREHWPAVATSFGEFLERLAMAQGDKYWEVGNRGLPGQNV
jgi:hypothetical protein